MRRKRVCIGMERPWKILIGLALAATVAVGLKWIVSSNPDDQKLIALALNDAIKAGREGRPGGVLDNLSIHVSVNGADYSGQQRQIADFVKKNNPDVSFENTRAVVTENEAKIVTPAALKLSLLGNNLERKINQVTLVFKKEDDHEWLVIPTRKWKLAEIQVPDTAIADLISGA